MIYDWKRNMPVKAQIAGEHLEKLEQENGKVTPRLIVDDSRPEDSVLHKCFDWDDESAAEKYRESQAGFILRNLVTVNVKQVPQEEPSEIRAFVSVVQNNQPGFVSIAKAMNDDDMRNQVLENALSELLAIKKKYAQLEQLSKVFAAIDEISA